jgi:hypothetical protein
MTGYTFYINLGFTKKNSEITNERIDVNHKNLMTNKSDEKDGRIIPFAYNW